VQVVRLLQRDGHGHARHAKQRRGEGLQDGTEKLEQELRDALEVGGIGAKRAAGYGRLGKVS
jgi:CRISPR/Cas system CMR subunit Cmr6 (Cas7 group RAMP superfamily)